MSTIIDGVEGEGEGEVEEVKMSTLDDFKGRWSQLKLFDRDLFEMIQELLNMEDRYNLQDRLILIQDLGNIRGRLQSWWFSEKALFLIDNPTPVVEDDEVSELDDKLFISYDQKLSNSYTREENPDYGKNEIHENDKPSSLVGSN